MRESSRFISWSSCTGSGAVVASLAFGASLVASAPAQADCCACLGDIDKNGFVDGADLGLLLGAWDGPGNPVNEFCEDVNFDGIVDGADLGLLLGAWDTCTPVAVDSCGHPCAGDCCEAHDTPNCNDGECCTTVCAIDPFCCATAWDATCVAEAETLCGALCGGGVCPNPDHDCCTTGTPGCSDQACCELACSLDPFCCSTAWDTFCVGPNGSVPGASAEEACGLDCGGGGDCPFAPPEITAECCAIVCAADPFCCQVAWDGICASEANVLCAGPCEFTCEGTPEGEACGDDDNGGCNVAPGGTSSCCVANGGVGCDDATCQSTVCACDPFCCTTSWDSLSPVKDSFPAAALRSSVRISARPALPSSVRSPVAKPSAAPRGLRTTPATPTGTKSCSTPLSRLRSPLRRPSRCSRVSSTRTAFPTAASPRPSTRSSFSLRAALVNSPRACPPEPTGSSRPRMRSPASPAAARTPSTPSRSPVAKFAILRPAATPVTIASPPADRSATTWIAATQSVLSIRSAATPRGIRAASMAPISSASASARHRITIASARVASAAPITTAA